MPQPTTDGSAAAPELARRSSGAVVAARASAALRAASSAAGSAFLELRHSLTNSEACIEPCRLKMIKGLGEGAFASMRHAELRPAIGLLAAAVDGSGRRGSGARLRDVAVKTLRMELLGDPEQVQLFAKEVSMLRKQRHRHNVEFIGCGWPRGSLDGRDDSVSGGAPKELYFVQEYCAGGSLGDLVRKQMVCPYKRLYSDSDALHWCLHIAMALQYLHSGRPVVMHRDLKLDSAMLSCADVAMADAKLADFGLARLAAAEDRHTLGQIKRMLSEGPAGLAAAVATAADSKDPLAPTFGWDSNGAPAFQPPGELTGKTGSLGYMAPEVLHNRQYDSGVDIFSLGMCMHNLFARTIPSFSILLTGGEEQLELFAAQVAGGYRPPLPAGLPAAVADTINACWKGEPGLRPNAHQVVKMLQAIQDSGEVEGSDSAYAKRKPQGCGCSIM